ncbi:transcriptional regulator [Thalassotalea litorea]|uniref:Transcriptional regulator n=1 Tax=Thalassotalea litorea TaxID=2020715 RepID=A0A5R9ILJ2_9GAMM|nr:SoxR reducing system RseC family protein [Thalassotalea litorea]TLU59909.1 transcriptional regulator [Thalassotalea litorea]
MIEETARVTRVEGNQVDVESVVKSGCSSCQQVDTCGSGQIAKGLGVRYMKLTLTTSLELKPGDEVVIALPQNHLLSAAMQVYLLPLIGLIIAAAIGQFLLVQQWQLHELSALSVGVFGGIGGFYLARYIQRQPQRKQALDVKILRKCDKSADPRVIPVNIRN